MQNTFTLPAAFCCGYCSRTMRLTIRIIFELNAPHKPRLDAIATMRILFAGRTAVNGLPADTSDDCETFCIISVSFEAYGRKRTIASCALRNLAALTIFIAFVICWVEITDAIRIRTSFKLAILNS